MAANPLQTYLALYAHVARLSLKAIGRKPHYLLVAPAAFMAYQQLSTMLFRMAPGQWGLIVGLLDWFMLAATLSLILFVGRSVVEQRPLGLDEVQMGLGAFMSDVMSILFPFWVLSLLIGGVSYVMQMSAVVLLPLFETAAFTAIGGYAIFQSAFSFARRDIFPWVFGQVPLLTLIALLNFFQRIVVPSLPFAAISLAVNIVLWALVLVGFIYRGILFLTLDNYSPRRRAERFGGEAGLG